MPSEEPPPPNPFASALEDFSRNTPFVTRWILLVQAISYLVSWIFNPFYVLGCIPLFVVYRFEVYRLFTSALVNTSLLSMLFSVWALLDSGRRLESSLGSAPFLWLCFCLVTVSNAGFVAIQTALFAMTGREGFLYDPAMGLWSLVLGVISVECLQSGAERRLVVVSIPAVYYPLALLALFCLWSGELSISYVVAIILGYGYKRFAFLKLSSTKARAWEDTWLRVLSRQSGWILSPDALGSGAWADDQSRATSTSGLVRTTTRNVLLTPSYLTEGDSYPFEKIPKQALDEQAASAVSFGDQITRQRVRPCHKAEVER